MPEPTRQYIFTEGQIRFAFIASGIGMVSILVLLLVLTSSRPQGRYSPADTTQFQNTLQVATANLEGYEVLDNGRARIDIETAMELVAERGVTLSLTSAAVSAEEVEAAEAAAQDSAGDEAAADDTAELPDGSAVYAQCSACHGGTGQGIPGAFPPLADWMPTLYNADGGREYLVDVLLYGLQGQIEAAGQTYNGLMPGWTQLSDGEIAAVLNHELTAWGNEAQLEDFEPYSAQDIADRRGEGLSMADVLEARGELDLP